MYIGWKPTTLFSALVDEMVEADIKEVDGGKGDGGN